jgi:hypothetical protein
MARQFIGVRLPEDLVEKAKIAADSEHRTLSNYILSLIADDIDRREKSRAVASTVAEPPAQYATAESMRAQSKRMKKMLDEAAQPPELRVVPSPEEQAGAQTHASPRKSAGSKS